ncbi:hypothetical protein AR454_01005 [Bacillus mycoides]|nr:hypothetical protein [Bacillus mycoides]
MLFLLYKAASLLEFIRRVLRKGLILGEHQHFAGMLARPFYVNKYSKVYFQSEKVSFFNIA